MKSEKQRMKPGAFARKYGRIIVGGVIILIVLLCSVCAPLLASHNPEFVDMAIAKQLPSVEHPLGTDVYGRDLWARIIYGSRSTLIISFGTQLSKAIFGTILGLLCGYYKWAEKIVMRILDAFATIPNLLMCLLMISVLGPGMLNLILAMTVHGIPPYARMIRNQVLFLREKEFVESEKAMGASDVRTLVLHILPHCSSWMLVSFTSGLAGNVLSMAALSYLGLGLDPSVANWGNIIQDGQTLMFVYPHLILYAGIAISITVFGFALLGDGMRDLLDPRTR